MGEQVDCIYEFGPFRLDTQKRLLLRAGEPVKLYPKEFEMLLVLVEQGGEVVNKDELLRKVWPDSIVEEGNLTTYVSHLRKALGETRDQHEYIVTVPGQGYRFVARVRQAFDEVVMPERTRAETVVRPAAERGTTTVTGNVIAITEASRHSYNVKSGPTLVPQNEGPTTSRSTVRVVISALVLVVTVAGAAAGVWLYQKWSRENEHRAGPSPSTKEVTLRRFATHGGVPIRATLSPDGKTVAYVQRIDGRDSLWLGQTTGNTSVQINRQEDLKYGEATFAPDGNDVFFTVSGGNRPQSMLIRMPVLGGVMTELIPNVHSPVTLSPDGRRLAFVREDDESKQVSIIIADAADGKNEHTLITRKRPESLSREGLSWSPDGKTIAVAVTKPGGREEVSTVSIANRTVKRIGTRDWGRIGNLAWLPDGSGIAMIARENAIARRAYVWFVPFPEGEERKITNDVNLYLMNSLSVSADGKLAVLQGFIQSAIWVAPDLGMNGAKRVLQGVAPRYEGVDGLTWTRDGRLLYTAYVEDNLAVWSMNRDGSDLRPLTVTGSTTVDSRISATPDGRYVVFQSNRSGGIEIWRANADGSGLKQLTTGGGNLQPSVSPDSRWIVFASERDGRTTLWRISIDGGEPVQLTRRPSSWPQVSPDGRFIAFSGTPEGTGDRLMVIPMEGTEPVRSFVPKTSLTGRRIIRWMPDSRAIIYKDEFQGLWRQGLEEKVPQPVTNFEQLQVLNLAWSFDGKNCAYTIGGAMHEIIMIEPRK